MQAATDTFTSPLVRFPHTDGSRVPYKVFSDPAVYALEQERIYRGDTWSFVALEAEIPKPLDYKSTFVGDTPVVVTRTEDGTLAAWVNRCAHRGAMVCRTPRGNAASHTCVYHQWSYDTRGNLQGVPFRRGQKQMSGMPPDFDPKCNGLRQLRVESYRGLVFASFSATVGSLADYIGAEMRPWVDRIFHKPIVYLGCTRQYSKSNWKLYFENVKDPYHASMLHLFHTTFNIFRVGMKARSIPDATHGLHSLITVTKNQEDNAAAYKQQNIRSMDDGFALQDDRVLGHIQEYAEATTNHIQPIFPQLVIQQIHNTLVARQLLPKGPGNFELVFHFFGYADDTPELRALRIAQANLVGPAGYISMEDTEATELVQRGTARDGDASSVIEMSRANPEQQDTVITESLIRKFWVGYGHLMGFAAGGGVMGDVQDTQALACIAARVDGVERAGSGDSVERADRAGGRDGPDGLRAMLRWFALYSLQERYLAVLDNDRLEEWPALFTEDCLYEIVPKENFDAGLPIGIVRCDNRRMLHDRVTSLRHANIYEAHTYRHMTSGLAIDTLGDDRVAMQSSYVVVRTLQNGESEVYQAGRYLDVVVRTQDGWRYQSKRVIYDTLRVQTLLATPI